MLLSMAVWEASKGSVSWLLIPCGEHFLPCRILKVICILFSAVSTFFRAVSTFFHYAWFVLLYIDHKGDLYFVQLFHVECLVFGDNQPAMNRKWLNIVVYMLKLWLLNLQPTYRYTDVVTTIVMFNCFSHKAWYIRLKVFCYMMCKSSSKIFWVERWLTCTMRVFCAHLTLGQLHFSYIKLTVYEFLPGL